MRTINIFFILLFLCPIPTRAFLTSGTELQKENQTVCLLSENHEKNPADPEQLETLKEILQTLDKDQQSRHVLIETPASICSFFESTQKVTSHLASTLEKLSLQNTTVENIEIRCISNAALYILQKRTDPKTISPEIRFNSCKKECTINTITFNDLKEELKEQEQIEKIIKKHIPDTEEASETLNDLLGEIKRNYQLLLEKLKQHNASDDILILDQAKIDTNRQELYDAISKASVPLLDLYVLYRILSLQDIPHLILIAGGYHVDEANTSLKEMGFHFQRNRGRNTQNESKPLSPEDLHVLFNQNRTKCTIL